MNISIECYGWTVLFLPPHLIWLPNELFDDSHGSLTEGRKSLIVVFELIEFIYCEGVYSNFSVFGFQFRNGKNFGVSIRGYAGKHHS
jgi:hypothetical protein